jgi:hypothetical protein
MPDIASAMIPLKLLGLTIQSDCFPKIASSGIAEALAQPGPTLENAVGSDNTNEATMAQASNIVQTLIVITTLGTI